MSGVDQGNTQKVRKTTAHIATVPIVTVDDVGCPAGVADERQHIVHEAVQVIPQGFLGKVFLRGAGGDAHDACPVTQVLGLSGIVLAHIRG